MLYNVRTNREINPSVMPDNWRDEGKYGMFTLYPSARERAGFMAKFSLHDNGANRKEIVCFLLSNYIAFENGLNCDAIALMVLGYGKHYSPAFREPNVSYTIGSIPRQFYVTVRNSLVSLPIKRANGLLYFVVSSFYNAPDRIVERMIKRIKELKNPCAKTRTYVSLQTLIPEKNLHVIQEYARNNGMTVNDVMKITLRSVCMSKRDRAEDCSPIARIFSLYRLLRQEEKLFIGERLVPLFVWVSDEREKKYLTKFLNRRKLSRSEILRKAVRAFIYIIEHKGVFAGKIQYVQEEDEEQDEMTYVYERLARMDFYRGIYR